MFNIKSYFNNQECHFPWYCACPFVMHVKAIILKINGFVLKTVSELHVSIFVLQVYCSHMYVQSFCFEIKNYRNTVIVSDYKRCIDIEWFSYACTKTLPIMHDACTSITMIPRQKTKYSMPNNRARTDAICVIHCLNNLDSLISSNHAWSNSILI